MRLHSIKPIVMAIVASLCLVQMGALVSSQSRSSDSLDKAVIDLFVRYPQDNNLNVIVYSHARREPMEKSGATFYSTWFLHGNLRVVMATVVDNDGQVFTYPLPNSEVGPTHSRWNRLANAGISEFLTTVRTLPESTASAPLPNLVIVSFRLDGKWQTRLYDRTRPPAELRKLYSLVHSPLDSN